MALFQEAVGIWQLPAAIYCDHGGENVRIADFMLANRGVDSDCVKVGSSKHNTRIERVWRDARNIVLDFYIKLFRQFEKNGMKVDDALCMFVLRYMYMPRIQEDLDQFIRTWNGHRLSTERYRTPLQLIELGRDCFPPAVDELTCVEYPDEDVDDLLPGQPFVEVSVLGCPFDDDALIQFKNQVRPLTLKDDVSALTMEFFRALDIAERLLV